MKRIKLKKPSYPKKSNPRKSLQYLDIEPIIGSIREHIAGLNDEGGNDAPLVGLKEYDDSNWRIFISANNDSYFSITISPWGHLMRGAAAELAVAFLDENDSSSWLEPYVKIPVLDQAPETLRSQLIELINAAYYGQLGIVFDTEQAAIAMCFRNATTLRIYPFSKDWVDWKTSLVDKAHFIRPLDISICIPDLHTAVDASSPQDAKMLPYVDIDETADTGTSINLSARQFDVENVRMLDISY